MHWVDIEEYSATYSKWYEVGCRLPGLRASRLHGVTELLHKTMGTVDIK